jgi:hypothetical protein
MSVQGNTKSRFDLNLIELVRPEAYAFPSPYSIEEAFQAFRWMVKTGFEYRDDGQWGSVGVREILSATSGIGLEQVKPIVSIEDLARRFQYALLGHGGGAVQRWRDDFKIKIGERVTIPYQVHKNIYGNGAPVAPADVKKQLQRLLQPTPGQKMAMSLNFVHHGVRHLHDVKIAVSPNAFRFDIHYGTDKRSATGYSSWSETLAKTRDGETFIETLSRARENFDLVVHGTKPAGKVDLEDMFAFHDARRKHVEFQLDNNFRTPEQKNIAEESDAQLEAATGPKM